MPYSLDIGKDIIKDWFAKQTNIKTIIDLGAGSGTYPKLLGNKYNWKAVEIYAPYVQRFDLDKLYKEIRIGDIRYTELPKGDCAIVCDVLEHLDKKDAIKVFKKIDKQFKHVVFGIPSKDIGHTKEGYNWNGNIFERHLSIWTPKELEKLVPKSYKIRKYIDPMAIFIK